MTDIDIFYASEDFIHSERRSNINKIIENNDNEYYDYSVSYDIYQSICSYIMPNINTIEFLKELIELDSTKNLKDSLKIVYSFIASGGLTNILGNESHLENKTTMDLFKVFDDLRYTNSHMDLSVITLISDILQHKELPDYINRGLVYRRFNVFCTNTINNKYCIPACVYFNSEGFVDALTKMIASIDHDRFHFIQIGDDLLREYNRWCSNDEISLEICNSFNGIDEYDDDEY